MRFMVPFAGVAAALLAASAGCQARQPLAASAEQGTSSASSERVSYTPARDGLPTGKIWKTQMAFGDIDGDGFPDLGTISRLADGPYIWRGDGKGNWTDASAGLPRESFCGGGMDFGDANRDGHTDVAISDHCRGVFVYFGDGQGNWRNASAGLPTIGSEDIAMGDFDKDGCLDVAIVAASEEGVRAFKGNCDGVWQESSTGLDGTGWGNAVAVADMDADGNLDIVAAHSSGPRVWLGDGTGKWTAASEGLPAPEIHGLYWGIAVGDVNGDGKLDIATGAALPGAEVFIQEQGDAGPRWRKSVEGIIPMNALGVAFGDLDKDGHTDLVVAGKSNLEEIGGVYGLFPFFGDGTGAWTLDANTGLPSDGRERTWGVALPDIDGDGVLDVAAAFGDVLAPSWRSGPKATGPKASAEFRKGWKELQVGMSAKDVAKLLGIEIAAPGLFQSGTTTIEAAAEHTLVFESGFFSGARLVSFEGPRPRTTPERGMFGSIDVWRGSVPSRR